MSSTLRMVPGRFAGLVLLAAASAVACSSVSTGEVISSHASALNGQRPDAIQPHRREVVNISGNSCTGTLIRPRWVLTASHCLNWMESYRLGTNYWAVQTSLDGRNWTTTYQVDRTFPVHVETVLSDYVANRNDANDIMLAHIVCGGSGQPACPTVTSSIATAPPADNAPVVGFGMGGFVGTTDAGVLSCMATGDDDVRYANWNYRATTFPGPICAGDSGGPLFSGPPSTSSPIVGVASIQGTGYANPIPVRSFLDTIMTQYDAVGANDIQSWGWCTHPGANLYWADVNGDSQVDAICHDQNDGRRWVALGANRVITEQWSNAWSFCAGTGRTLFTGDFNADGRTDLLCRQPDGFMQIDLANDAGSAFYNTSSAGIITVPYTGWCSHATAQLHVGDFNGDGRSDLLCHDVATGMKWIDLGANTSTFFDGVSNWSTSAGWCAHTGAKLLVAEVNGDERSDLVCHSTTDGHLFVQVNASAANPFAGTTTDETPGSDTPSCAVSSDCAPGRQCISGRCTIRFCDAVAPGVVSAGADYSGDGIADIMCTTSTGTTGIRPFKGQPSRSSDILSGFDDFAWFGGAFGQRPRRIKVSRPWNKEQ